MKIERIEAIPLRVPFTDRGRAHAWRGKDYSQLEVLLVRVETSDGLVGWGEAFAYNCQAAVCAAINHTIAPVALGRDSRQIGPLSFDLQKVLHIYGRYGILNFALSGLDIALWDIAGKRSGRSVSELLGGARVSEVEAYASLFRYHDPDQVAEGVRAALDRGYRIVKIHERTAAEARAAREAAGPDVPLMMDTNCSWSPQEAIELAHKIKPYGFRWLEEPVFPPEDLTTLARIQTETGVAIASGENACTAFEFQKIIAARAATFVQPSVTKVGGITEFRKVVVLAEVGSVSLVGHTVYFAPGLLATLHLAATQNQPPPVEYFCISLEAKPYGQRFAPNRGKIQLPDTPGLGCEPDPDFIKEYRVDI